MSNQNYRVCGVKLGGEKTDTTFHRTRDTAEKQAAKLRRAYDKLNLQIIVEIRFRNTDNKWQLIANED